MTSPGAHGWSGVDTNGTGISMYPAPTEKMMNDIAEVLRVTRDSWTEADGKIQDLAGNLGDGPLGKPFKKQYEPTAKKLRELVTDMVGQLSKLSAEGSKAPPLYVAADLKAGQYFEF
jgi:hypothetical protein